MGGPGQGSLALITVRRLSVVLLGGLATALLVAGQLGAAAAQPQLPAAARPQLLSVLGSQALVPQQCPYATTALSNAPLTTMRSAALCIINTERNALGLPSLKASARLNRVAQQHTRAMVASRELAHGADFTARFSAVGYNWRAAGENIAAGFGTPLSVVDAWMASPEHCRNLLNPAFRDIGIGAAAAGVDSSTDPGTWTADLGLRMSQSAPSGNSRPQSGCPYQLGR